MKKLFSILLVIVFLMLLCACNDVTEPMESDGIVSYRNELLGELQHETADEEKNNFEGNGIDTVAKSSEEEMCYNNMISVNPVLRRKL